MSDIGLYAELKSPTQDKKGLIISRKELVDVLLN